jgi:hypothetical protein
MSEGQRHLIAQCLKQDGEVGPAAEAEFSFDECGVLDPADARRQQPATPGVERCGVREVPGDDGRSVSLERHGVLRPERRRCRDDVEPEADPRRLLQSSQMGGSTVLHGQAAVEELVRLHVLAGELAVGVVVLREEAHGPEHDDVQSMLVMCEAAELLRRELGHPVDIARPQRRNCLIEPHSRATLLSPDAVRDHQRGRRGENETRDAVARRRFEQCRRSRDVDVDEGAGLMALDVGLVKRGGVDHAVEAMRVE